MPENEEPYDDVHDDPGDEGYDYHAPDPVVRRMLVVAGLLVIAILGVIAVGVYVITRDFQGPRTAGERRLRLAEATAEVAPREYDVLIELAFAQIATEKYSAAERTLDKIFDAEPDRAGAFLARGQIEFARGDRGAALKWYLDGLKLADRPAAKVKADMKKKGVILPEPYHQDAANQLAYEAAMIYMQRKDYKRAAEKLEYALEVDPQDSSSWVVLGDVRAELKDEKGAEKAYREALRFVPGYEPALEGLKKMGVKP